MKSRDGEGRSLSDSPPKKAKPHLLVITWSRHYLLHRWTPPNLESSGGHYHTAEDGVRMKVIRSSLSVDKKTVSALIGWPAKGHTVTELGLDGTDCWGRTVTTFQHSVSPEGPLGKEVPWECVKEREVVFNGCKREKPLPEVLSETSPRVLGTQFSPRIPSLQGIQHLRRS